MQSSQGLNVESHQAIRVAVPMRKDHTDRAYCRRGWFPQSLSATSKKAAVDKPQDRHPAARAALEAAGYTLADYYFVLGPANIIVIHEPPDALRGFGIDDARRLGDSFIGRNCAVVHHRGGDDGGDKDGPGTEQLQAADRRLRS